MKLTRAQLLSFFFVFFLSFLITASPAGKLVQPAFGTPGLMRKTLGNKGKFFSTFFASTPG